MDHAHLLQRAGRNLRRLDGRSRPTPRSAPATRAPHRPSLPPSRQHQHPHLHRRLPLLRRQSLARLPQHPPPHLIGLSSIPVQQVRKNIARNQFTFSIRLTLERLSPMLFPARLLAIALSAVALLSPPSL